MSHSAPDPQFAESFRHVLAFLKQPPTQLPDYVKRAMTPPPDLHLVTPTPALRPVASPTTLAEALAFYASHNLPVTPVRPGDKKGRLTGWSLPGHSATASEFRSDDNVGVLNGTQPTEGYFFHDVDIDSHTDAARLIVERLLPPTGWRYGRASKPRSHASYLVRGQLRTRRYIGGDGKVIIELRGITQKKTHTLSVGPGSTHESGEPIRFCEPLRDIGLVDDADDLNQGVQHAAVGIVIVQVWPANNRHRLRLAFAKVLIEQHVSPEHAIEILEAVMDVTGSDVADVSPAVRSTADAMRTCLPTEGAAAVLEVLGDETGRATLKTIAHILRSTVMDGVTGIIMRGGQLSAIVDRAEAALLTMPIYQRGGVLIRTIKLDTTIGDYSVVRREISSTILIVVREPWLVEQMGRVLNWYQPSSNHEPIPADPRPIYSRTLLSRGEWRFPVLRNVVTAPTLGRDGRIIAEPGFDAASGLLLDITPETFPPIPLTPTKEDAVVALRQLVAPLRGFPFVDDASRSVALSAMLTALVRPSLRTAPLHGYDAPIAGTGKSLLAEMVGLLATGFRPPALSQGKTAEEDEKRLSTVLFAGDPVIHIDNCERQIAGDFLCSMLTQEIVQARILGFSERRVLPSTALVLASGNNLTCAGDVSRRAVFCRLDAQIERPDTRTFDFDCHTEVLAARPELVVAGLTILRGYHVAGRPVMLTPMGSFADWDWIRGALVWLGCADPADTRAAILASDPRKDDLIAVMDLWQEAFNDQKVTVAYLRMCEGPEVRELQAKLIDVACRGTWSGKSVGWWLRGHKDRVASGRCFHSKDGNDAQIWWLETVGPQKRPPDA